MTAPSSVDRLRQAIANTLSIDAQGLQAAIGQLVVATSADYPAAGPEDRSLYSAAVRTTVLLADRIPAGQEAQALAQEIDRHHGRQAAQAVLGARTAELLGMLLVVDGTDEFGNFAGDAQSAPFVIFDVERQENIAGPFDSRELAEQRRMAILAGEPPVLDSEALLKHAALRASQGTPYVSLTYSQLELELSKAAIRCYRELISSPTSADRDALGDVWADREVDRADALLEGKLASASREIKSTAGTVTSRNGASQPTFIAHLAQALPANEGYEKGFKDALESMALALAPKVTQPILDEAITTALDAYANNADALIDRAPAQGIDAATAIPVSQPPQMEIGEFGWPVSKPVLGFMASGEPVLVTFELPDEDEPETVEIRSKDSERWDMTGQIAFWTSIPELDHMPVAPAICVDSSAARKQDDDFTP